MYNKEIIKNKDMNKNSINYITNIKIEYLNRIRNKLLIVTSQRPSIKYYNSSLSCLILPSSYSDPKYYIIHYHSQYMPHIGDRYTIKTKI